MELSEYLAALRRHWVIWTGATLLGALAALAVFVQTPKTYEATAGVFVSPSGDGSAQFVQQRVKSYPEIVTSAAVLDPVVAELGLDVSSAELRSRVSATNPAETTQLYITVTGPDADGTAAIANAVAVRFAVVVGELETPTAGLVPVNLTVADPAVVPDAPSSPVLPFLVGLGVLTGLLLGLAAAVARSRLDTRVHSADDLRRAWADDGTEVLVQPSGRARRSMLTGQTALTLARRLELRAEEHQSVRVVLLSPSPAEKHAARTFAEKVATALRGRGVDATVTGSDVGAGAVADDGPRIRLEIADPLVPLRAWKHVAERYGGVVLVATSGRVESGELLETQRILRSAGITPLAIALLRGGRRGKVRPTETHVEPPAVAAPRTPPGATLAKKSPKRVAVSGSAAG